MTDAATKKLKDDVKRFLEVYRFLSAEGKAQFEAQMAGNLKKTDERTKTLYLALFKAAKDGKNSAEAIAAMEKAAT